jgi:hypothetical protein
MVNAEPFVLATASVEVRRTYSSGTRRILGVKERTHRFPCRGRGAAYPETPLGRLLGVVGRRTKAIRSRRDG